MLFAGCAEWGVVLLCEGLTVTTRQLEIDIISLNLTERLPFRFRVCFAYRVSVCVFSICPSHGRFCATLQHALLGAAVTRGVFFEINMAAMLTDGTARCVFPSPLSKTDHTDIYRSPPSNRRNLISGGVDLALVARGHGLVISGWVRQRRWLHGLTRMLSRGTSEPGRLRAPLDLCNMGRLMGLTQEQALLAVRDATRAVVYHGLSRRSAKSVIMAQPLSAVPVDEHWKLSAASPAVAAQAVRRKGAAAASAPMANQPSQPRTKRPADDEDAP